MRVAYRGWLIAAPLLFTACASIAPPQPPSLDLPKPPTDLRASRKGNKVTLSWTIPTATTDRQRIRNLGPTLVCRAMQATLKECGTPVGKAPAETVPGEAKKKASIGKKSSGPKVAESYTDEMPSAILSDDPTAFATYTVEVLNPENRGAGLSNAVRVSSARSLPPPADLNARVTGQGIVLSWTNASMLTAAAIHYVYRVHRRQEGATQPSLVGEVPAGDDRTLTFTDSTIEWQKTYEYQVQPVTVIAPEGKSTIEVSGEESPEVKVFANDVFPPAVPSAVEAAASGPGQPPFIDLIWAPDSESDLAGYNVYRREDNGATVRVNSELIRTPAYRDEHLTSGKTYFYSVSAVDVQGNESARSEEVSEAVHPN